MSSVDSIASSQVALTQAQVQARIAARMLKVAESVGNPNQLLEMVKQTAEAAAETMNSVMEDAIGGLDQYA